MSKTHFHSSLQKEIWTPLVVRNADRSLNEQEMRWAARLAH